MFPTHVRAYIYRVLTAAAPILSLHGVTTDTEATLYLALASTILGVGLAAANTPTKGA
jgi:hypothetical protein